MPKWSFTLVSGAGGVSPILVEITQNLISMSRGEIVTINWFFMVLAIVLLFIIGAFVGYVVLSDNSQGPVKPLQAFLVGVSAPALIMNAYVNANDQIANVVAFSTKHNSSFTLFGTAHATPSLQEIQFKIDKDTSGEEGNAAEQLNTLRIELSKEILRSSLDQNKPITYSISNDSGTTKTGILDKEKTLLSNAIGNQNVIIKWHGMETTKNLVHASDLYVDAKIKTVNKKELRCKKLLFSKRCKSIERKTEIPTEFLVSTTNVESEQSPK